MPRYGPYDTDVDPQAFLDGQNLDTYEGDVADTEIVVVKPLLEGNESGVQAQPGELLTVPAKLANWMVHNGWAAFRADYERTHPDWAPPAAPPEPEPEPEPGEPAP